MKVNGAPAATIVAGSVMARCAVGTVVRAVLPPPPQPPSSPIPMSPSAIIVLLLMIAPHSTRRHSQARRLKCEEVCIRKEPPPAMRDIFFLNWAGSAAITDAVPAIAAAVLRPSVRCCRGRSKIVRPRAVHATLV